MNLKDFQGRINQDLFSDNIEKSYDGKEFETNFPSNKFKVLEASSVQNFIDTIKKGVETLSLTDKEGADKLLQKSIADVKRLKKVNLIDDLGQRDVFVMEVEKSQKNEKLEKAMTDFKEGKLKNDKGEVITDRREALLASIKEIGISKADGSELDEEDENELEKGIVSDAFQWQSNIKFTKTGKEMKEKMALVIPTLETQAGEVLKALDDASDLLEYQPTEKIDPWRLRQFKHIIISPYKIFNWNQTYYYEKDAMNSAATSVIADSGLSCSPCASKEEADICSKWNQLVYKYVDILYEIELLKMYKENLEDKKVYELTSDQLVALGV